MPRSTPPSGPSRARPADARPALRALVGPAALLLASLPALPGAAAAQASECQYGEIFLKNYAPVTVDYAVGSDPQRFHALAPGESTSYCAEEPQTQPERQPEGEEMEPEEEPQGELRVRLLDSERAYGVPPGGHHVWWIEEEGRFGLDFDSNYFIPGPPEEREYRLENRLDTPVPFRLDGKFRRLDDGRALTLTWTGRWQPQVTFRTDEGVRTYRMDEPCFAFTVVRRDGTAGFAVCE